MKGAERTAEKERKKKEENKTTKLGSYAGDGGVAGSACSINSSLRREGAARTITTGGQARISTTPRFPSCVPRASHAI